MQHPKGIQGLYTLSSLGLQTYISHSKGWNEKPLEPFSSSSI